MLDEVQARDNDHGNSSPFLGSSSFLEDETDNTNRLVYKLVRVGDDGTVLPATEEDLMQVESYVEGGFSSDEDDSDANVENEDEISGDEQKYVPIKDGVTEAEDLEAERRKLLARLKVLDAMLLKVKAEEQQREHLEGLVDKEKSEQPHFLSDANQEGKMRNLSFQSSGHEIGLHSPSHASHSSGCELPYESDLGEQWPWQNSDFVHGSVEGRGSEQATANYESEDYAVVGNAGKGPKSVPISLDNLSIRELHEAYRTTFGRETSVKDKHWLKRQISHGLSGVGNDSAVEMTTRLSALQARLKVQPSAEQPLNLEEPLEETGLASSPEKVVISNGKRSHRKVSNLEKKMEDGPLDEFSNGCNDDFQPQSVDGKRQRKPNRRYLEDDEDGVPVVSNMPVNEQKHPKEGNKIPMKVNSDGIPDGDEDSTLATVGMNTFSRTAVPQGRRTKVGSNAMKRKAEQRAAKLVRMARSSRAIQHSADNHREQSKLTMEQGKADLYEGTTDQSLFQEDLTDGEPSETIQTPHGGSRRKHHRPWTLREVMILIDGVERCGGGKWADIKKLEFSSVTHRTAVDLKDKWRNLLRASRIQAHARQGDNRKKHFAVAIPAAILARVRELATLHKETSNVVPVGRTSRSGRPVHRRVL